MDEKGLYDHAVVRGIHVVQDCAVLGIHQRVEEPMCGAGREGRGGAGAASQSLLVEPALRIGSGGLQAVGAAGRHGPGTQFMAGGHDTKVFASARHEDIGLDDLAVPEPQGGGDVGAGLVFVGCERETRETDGAGGVFVPSADGHDVQGLSWREQGPLRALGVDRLENRSLPCGGGGLLQFSHRAERRYRQWVADVAGADEEQDSEPVGQVVEKSAPGAHRSGEGPILVSERQIDEKYVWCGGATVSIPSLHPQDRTVDRIEQEPVGPGPLVRGVAWSVEHGSEVERTSERGLREIAVAMEDERGHLRTVDALRDDAECVEIVRIVEEHAAVQQPVGKNGHTVEECGNRGQISGRRWFSRSVGSDGVDVGGRFRGRLRSDEHDVIADRE